ncbi:MAG TPA: acetate--CoA ligase family protein [Syntrophobacteraceae bacterium]|nr:acetate--CoA ligase family protein [Syntrophobacteraceae bacterium]
MPSELGFMFNPASIAVIGASEDPRKYGHEILKNLIEGGFQGAIHPINPKAEMILGLNCYRNVREVSEPVDLAVIIIPAKIVPQAVRDCGERGIKGAVVISGGFSEAGPQGDELQKELAAVAAQNGVRLLGPNCQGVNNPYHSMCATWPLLTRRGRIAVISQSGTVGAAMLDWLEEDELGVSGFAGLGNRADINEVELIEHYEADPNTKVIACYLEGIKDADRFRKTLETLTKPLVMLKSGRTPRGRIAAESHTKSLAGTDAIYSALITRYGVHRADTLEELYDFSKAFAYLKPPAGNRIVFVTTSGGAAILATDAAEKEGLDTAPLPAQLAQSLEGIVPGHAIRSNPLDLTGDATSEMFKEVIETVRPHFDTVGVIFGDPIQNASESVKPNENELVIFLGGSKVERAERLKMHRNGIPVFQTPERGIRALSQLIPAAAKGARAGYTLPESSARSQMDAIESFNFLASKGFDCIFARLARSPGEAVHLAHRIGFPVALKINSPDILHKSDWGGVRLHLRTPGQLREAYGKITETAARTFPAAAVTGMVVYPMAAPGVELVLGMIRDPQFGPVIMFGLGGVTVELFRDVSMSLFPLTRDAARAMLGQIKGAPLLKGFRGSPPIDEDAVVEGLLRIAGIAAEHPEIAEIDLNPVIAYPEGMLVVDARIIRA